MPGKGRGIILKGTPTKKPVKRVSAAEAAALVARAKARRKDEGMLECEKEVLRRRGR